MYRHVFLQIKYYLKRFTHDYSHVMLNKAKPSCFGLFGDNERGVLIFHSNKYHQKMKMGNFQ